MEAMDVRGLRDTIREEAQMLRERPFHAICRPRCGIDCKAATLWEQKPNAAHTNIPFLDTPFTLWGA